MDYDSLVNNGKVKRSTYSGKPSYLTQTEINGNYYLLFIGPPNDKLKATTDKIFIEVWATKDGTKEPIPDNHHNLGNSYSKNYGRDKIASNRMHLYKFNAKQVSFDEWVSETINEAVCTLEEKQDKEEKFIDDVLAALEANKKAHEGIDYELE